MRSRGYIQIPIRPSVKRSQDLLELVKGHLQRNQYHDQCSLADAYLQNFFAALSDFILYERPCHDSLARWKLLSITGLRTPVDKIRSIPNR